MVSDELQDRESGERRTLFRRWKLNVNLLAGNGVTQPVSEHVEGQRRAQHGQPRKERDPPEALEDAKPIENDRAPAGVDGSGAQPKKGQASLEADDLRDVH